jgi:hypothetical protein
MLVLPSQLTRHQVITAVALFFQMGSVIWGAPNRSSFISGTVTDANGSVIDGATVVLKCGRHESLVTTGALGQFEMEAVSNARCQITASAPQFRTTSRSFRALRKNIALDPIVLQLQERAPSTGLEPANSVYLPKRADGICIEGEVAISPIPVNEDIVFRQVVISLSEVGETKPLAVVHPDLRGRFKFVNVKPGRYVLKGSLSGYPESQSTPFFVTKTRLTHVNLFLGTNIVTRELTG